MENSTQDLINILSQSQQNVDTWLVNYIKDHAYIVDNFIDSKGLYNIYLREQDGYSQPDYKTGGIYLLASFATFSRAEQWVLKNGLDATLTQLDNCDTPTVLTIIYQQNYDQSPNDYPSDYTNNYMIADKKHPTYAFTCDGYNMALTEHIKVFTYNLCDDVIPRWIFKIKDGIVSNDCTKEHINNIMKNYQDGEFTQNMLIKYEQFINENLGG